nr:hypothetical protein [Rhizobium sp. RM]
MDKNVQKVHAWWRTLPSPLPAKEREMDTAGAERNIPTVSLPPIMAKEVKSTPQIATAPREDQAKSVRMTNFNMRRRADPNSPLLETFPTSTFVPIAEQESVWARFIRINFGCQRSLLNLELDRMAFALKLWRCFVRHDRLACGSLALHSRRTASTPAVIALLQDGPLPHASRRESSRSRPAPVSRNASNSIPA